MLLTLTSASRVDGLHNLDKRFMARTKNKNSFYFDKLSKSWRKGQKPPVLGFLGYPDDKDLRVVTAVDEYLLRTSDWRKGNHQIELLLSHIKPHKEVVSSKISGWVKATLKLAGVDVDIFQPHSTRAASTSKSNATGLALGEILGRESWFNAFPWQRFYKKGIIPTTVAEFQTFLTNQRSIPNNRQRFEQRKEIWVPAKLSVVLRIQYLIEPLFY